MLNSIETLSQKFVRRGSWIFFFTLLSAPLWYIIRIVLTGDLSKDEVGIIYGAIWLLTLFSSYNDLGLTESLNYFLPKYIVKKDYARSKYLLIFAFLTQIITSIIIGAIFYFLADFLADWHFKNPLATEVIQVMSLFFVGLNMMQISTILFSATQNTKFQKWADFFRLFMTMIGMLGLFLLDQWSLLHYAWAWIIGLFLGVILSLILNYRYYYVPYFSNISAQCDTSTRNAFIKYSLATFLTANIGTLLHMLDQQILQNLTSTSEGATYAMYLSLVGVPFIFLSPLIGFLFPVIAELHSREDTQKISIIYSHFSSAFMVLTIWVSAIFLMIGPQIAIFLYGHDYLASGEALGYIAPFLILNILISINFQIMSGVGMIRERIMILIKTLIFNVVLIFAMIVSFQHGYIPFPSATSATAFAVWFAWILMWILSHLSVKKYHGRIDWKWFFVNLIVICITLFMVKFFDFVQAIPDFWLTGRITYFIKIVTILILSWLLFLMFNIKKMKEFFWTIRWVKNEI